MQIIGLSGTNGSGKDTIAHLLARKYGFYSASASEMLEAELKKRKVPFSRENKRNLSAEWRRESGLGVIVDKGIAAAKAAGFDTLVVGSLRNAGEVDRVHELNGTVIWVDADPKVRYERITSNDRGRIEDQKTFEEFMAEQQAEMQSDGDAAKLSLADVKAGADILIDNSASITEFEAQVEKVLADIL